MSTPVTIQIQIDPESMNDYPVGGKPYLPVDPKHYPIIDAMVEDLIEQLQQFGYIRSQIYIGLEGEGGYPYFGK